MLSRLFKMVLAASLFAAAFWIIVAIFIVYVVGKLLGTL